MFASLIYLERLYVLKTPSFLPDFLPVLIPTKSHSARDCSGLVFSCPLGLLFGPGCTLSCGVHWWSALMKQLRVHGTWPLSLHNMVF